MKSCTFFGHRDCPDTIKASLEKTIEDLIVHENVSVFYVGNQGQFDAYVRGILRKLAAKYPAISYAVVLAYMPRQVSEYEDFSDTMLPEGIENIHPRYAISWRNKWMLDRSDFVISYVTHSWGGAAKYVADAKRHGKIVIPL